MYGMGWLRELPDQRDWDVERLIDERPLFAGAPGFFRADEKPKRVDLRRYCSPVEQQGRLGSCTAQAAVGIVEYLERRSRRKHLDASRLFVYKMARQLDGLKGDTGAYIRSAMKALKIFGAPPERYWPYDIAKFDEDPTTFVYLCGQSFRTIQYYRIDWRRSRHSVVNLMRTLLVKELPIIFGFVVYNWGNDDGEFLMPEKGDRPHGGHAIMAVGYDDERQVGKSTGAFLIRNSWGTGWGDEGYGWLPYDYVLYPYSSDFWTIFRQDYLLD